MLILLFCFLLFSSPSSSSFFFFFHFVFTPGINLFFFPHVMANDPFTNLVGYFVAKNPYYLITDPLLDSPKKTPKNLTLVVLNISLLSDYISTISFFR